jgi:hypothetical protein
MNTVAIYTAIFGGRDNYKEPLQGDYDCFLFTDEVVPTTHATVVHVPFKIKDDPVRTARFLKTMSHVFLAGYRYTLWIDGSIEMVGRNIHKIMEPIGGIDMVTFKHRDRDCIYSEEKFCVDNRKDDPEVIRAQMDRYRADGFPEHAGTFETGVLLRHQSRKVADFNNAWWAEIEAGSKRDQLSLAYVMRKTGVKVGTFGTVADNPYFVLHDHKNRG